MKQWKRVVALILTLILTVYGLPAAPTAYAVTNTIGEGGTSAEPESTLPTSAMRFVQTGFDSTTGILTMSLQIKPTPGENGETVREGVFAFQTDATKVVPITRPATTGTGGAKEERNLIRPYSKEKIAAVLTVDSNSTEAIKNFVNGAQYTKVSELSFSNALNCTASNMMVARYSGFMVSRKRTLSGESKKLDCYLQFYFQNTPAADENGYITVMELDFQCFENDGSTKATSTDVLSAGSIVVPKTAEEAQAVVEQFKYTANGDDVKLAMGAAGFIQKYYDNSTNEYKEGSAYYYYREPQITTWRQNGGSRANWSTKGATAITAETVPAVKYENCDRLYYINEVQVSNRNTSTGDVMDGTGTAVTNPDFDQPSNESSKYPRYNIPSYAKSLENDESRNWVPEAYNTKNGKRPLLKYYSSVAVSADSDSSPLHEFGIESFFGSLNWQFVITAQNSTSNVSLEDLEITVADGEGKLVPTTDGEYYRVKEATITDTKYTTQKWYGKKLWVTYKVTDQDNSGGDVYFMRTPVGVTVDMLDSEVTYYDSFDTSEGEKTETLKTPQLHVIYEAADTDNFIWNTAQAGPVPGGEKSCFALRAVYSTEEKNYYGSDMMLGLYKETATPTLVDVSAANILVDIENSDGDDQLGFYVGNANLDGTGSESITDPFTEGVDIKAVLCDQYHVGYVSKLPAISLVPSTKTAKLYKNAGKECPFEVVQSLNNKYTIKYKDGHGVNDIVEGIHILRATYTEIGTQITIDQEVYVGKAKDRLAFMNTTLATSYDSKETTEVDGGRIHNVVYSTPSRDTSYKASTVTEYVNISELANQWRDTSYTPEDPTVYDIVSGLRKTGGAVFDIDKARQSGISVTYETQLTYPAGEVEAGVDISDIQKNGKFTFNSNTPDGTKLKVKITAEYNGSSRFEEYNFTFSRAKKTLQQIKVKGLTGSIVVPVKSADDEKVLLTVNPFDQYGSQWNWDGVLETYTTYGAWSVIVDGTLPKGVTLTGANNQYVNVTSEAETCEFDVYAKFGNITSEKITISIARAPSKPTTLSSLVYGSSNKAESPSKNRSDLKINPTIKVYDQYEEELSTYTQSWTATVTPAAAKDYISINSKTGGLTVKSCAPECTVKVKGAFASNGASKSAECTVTVTRSVPYPETVSITENSVDYPASNSTASAVTYLTATATTQYGDGQTFNRGEIAWTLDSVTFADGTTLNRTKLGSDNETQIETGDIPLSSGTYSARGGVIKMNTEGGISFGGTTLADNVPTSIKVSVTAGSVTVSKTITIARESSKATVLYFSPDIAAYSDGVQIPEKGNTVTVPLEVYARDQYGIVMKDAGIEWSCDNLPKGVKLDKTAKKITVDHTAPVGSVALKATCGTLDNVLYITIRQDEPLRPAKIEFTGMKDSSGTNVEVKDSKATVELPAPTGTKYNTYTAAWIVRDQFDNPVSKSVKWSVKSKDSDVNVEITDETAGMVRLNYTDGALDTLKANGTLTFVLCATAIENSAVSSDMTVSIKLADPIATYASPELVAGYNYGSDPTKPLVPKKGEAANKITVKAVVYDQYGREMSGETGKLKLITSMSGLKFTQNSDASTGTLEVTSAVTGLYVTMQATPASKPNSINDNSKLQIVLSKGTAYAAELALVETNVTTFKIPTWSSSQLANVPDEDTYEELTLKAEIRDQYGAEMTSATLYKPVWEFVGEHEGVEFAQKTRAAVSETVEGNGITLSISNRAVPAGKLNHTVTLKLHTTNMENNSDFEQIFNLTLTRDAPQATFLYITGASEDGEETDPAKRPYANEKTTVYQFSPVVYDQYGAPIETNEILMDMDKSSITANDIEIEDIYKRGESAEKGNEPIQYKIYKVQYSGPEDTKGTKTLLAEFDRETGKLTVYTACDSLGSLMFTANYQNLGAAGKKSLVVPIATETLRPYSVKINRSHGDFTVRGGEEPIYDYVYATVYDQYGDVYNGAVTVNWRLLLNDKDDQGEYLPYSEELDKDGNPRPTTEFLVQKTDNVQDGSTTLKVLPESFFENKFLLLECKIVDNNKPLDTDSWVYEYAKINVKKPSSGSSANTTVTFDAGEYGKLVGESTVLISPGSAPLTAPGVKTVEGYGFVGWTSDGNIIVDATQVVVYSDTTYTAVYKDITNTKFLSGYTDMTIRPDKRVTRAEFVTMVVRAIGGYDSTKNYGESFKDVPAGKWYANTVAYAKQMNLIGGYEDGTFRPNSNISRAEAAKILAEAAQLTSEKTGTFSDIEAGKWYEKHIEALAEANVVIGYDDGTFRPGKQINRAEAAKMIVMVTKNALNTLERENIQKYAYCAFTDIKKTHWAYPYILRGAGIA